jgi:hypothetical protein
MNRPYITITFDSLKTNIWPQRGGQFSDHRGHISVFSNDKFVGDMGQCPLCPKKWNNVLEKNEVYIEFKKCNLHLKKDMSSTANFQFSDPSPSKSSAAFILKKDEQFWQDRQYKWGLKMALKKPLELSTFCSTQTHFSSFYITVISARSRKFCRAFYIGWSWYFGMLIYH